MRRTQIIHCRDIEVNLGQSCAIIERILADARDAIGYRYACEPRAMSECSIADARDAVWYCDTRESRTIIECISADACYASVGRNDTILATQNQSLACSIN